ncbi:MAG: hypothetical protein H7336_12220, partial [Bacteriovorax sp.]|nr:hypothetical protein [Bacteriovorax sp.]
MKLILLIFFYSFSTIIYSTEVDLNDVVLSANDSRAYANIRESKSRYINKENVSIVLETYKDSYKLGIIKSIIDDSKINKCASKLLLNLSQSLHTDQDNDVENAILALRLDNAIDDVTVSILIRSLKTKVSLSLPIKSEGLNSDDESAAQKIYASKILDFRKGNTCPEDSYISLYASVSS